MKTLLIPALTISLLTLAGCATPNGTATQNTTANTINTGFNIGKTVFQTQVNNRCRSEINNNQLWKAAKVIYNETKQEQIQSSVCGCVSNNAVRNVTNADLMTAAVDQNYRSQMVVTAVANTLNSCYTQTINSFTQP